MLVPVAILGASGYVGAELLRLMAQHPVLRPSRLYGDSQVGATLAEVHPHLAAVYPAMQLERFDPAGLDDIGLVLAALPHGESQKIAGDIVDRGIPFVDLGADFRLNDAATYERWYKHEHGAAGLLDRFVYGIPELHRDRIAGAKAVASAGCYATGSILALKPLAGLVEPGSIIIDAASGVSGAGKSPNDSVHFNSVDENFSAYGLLNHRHTAEIEMELGEGVLFTPHLAPMNRGILATCYATAKAPFDPLSVLAAAYANEPFVHVAEAPPQTKWTLASNSVHLTARYDERTGRVLAIAALDNLTKGAAGQMIQCANIMLGLDETAGLPIAGIWP
jgi:N-acetyl-gamma-glutamyl-phosphate reductase